MMLEKDLQNPSWDEKMKTRRRRRRKMSKEVWNTWKWNISIFKRKSRERPLGKNVANENSKWASEGSKIITRTISLSAETTTANSARNLLLL